MSDIIKKLPTVLQTTPEKKFFDATFDQVFSKKDSEYLAGYMGRRVPGKYTPDVDFYIPEPSKNRTAWQLEPTCFTKNSAFDKTNIVFYEDLLNRIEYYGGDTGNHARLFDSEYYSWAPPIDYDMFVNYHNYYWVDNSLPVITINGVTLEEIVGREYYFIPGTTIKLSSGMVITLPDDPFGAGVEYYVEIIDGAIRLIKKYDVNVKIGYQFLPWDGTILSDRGTEITNKIWDKKTWEVEARYGQPEYITIGRGSVDNNIWSRRNRWIHIDVLQAVLDYTKTPWPPSAIRGSRPIIQYDSSIELFRSGIKFLADIRYAIDKLKNGKPALLGDIQNKTPVEISSLLGVGINDGDLIILTNDSRTRNGWLNDGSQNTSLTSYVFRATLETTGKLTFSPLLGWNRPVEIDEIVYTTDDVANGPGAGESWHYRDTGWVFSYNNVPTATTGPIFQLYDCDGVKLDDAAKYPNSTFYGSKIFSYKVNPIPGATVDPVLKFPIVYSSSGQSSDIIFENFLITERYTYSAELKHIDGYYYYHIINDPVHKNGWELYTTVSRTVGAVSHAEETETNAVGTGALLANRRSKQRVLDRFVLTPDTLQFKLSVVPSYIDNNTFDTYVRLNGNLIPETTYSFSARSGSIYIDLAHFFNTTPGLSDMGDLVVEIASYTHDALPDSEYGYFEIPQQLEANPNQLEIGEISGSELTEHFASIIAAQPGIVGAAFGGTNNYRDTIKNKSLGRYILQNMTPALKSMLVSSDADLDIVAAIRYAQDEYIKFKNRYLNTAATLIKTEFDPVQYFNNTVLIGQWVDEIFKTVNVSKEFSKAFAYSYMLAHGRPSQIETFVVDTTQIYLENYIDLARPQNILYVYDNADNERLLVLDVDYKITSSNNLIELEILDSALLGKELSVVFYEDMQPCYVPATPAKLGLSSVYIPRIETDYTYADPVDVIVGHDGSRTVVYGDYRDQLLLELERRIYNAIDARYRNEYIAPVNLTQVKSGFFRQTEYQFSEYLNVTEHHLNRWCARNKANFRLNEWTYNKDRVPQASLWKLYNYSRAEDVFGNKLALPGHWRGVFMYLYDTVHPDTKPWEMLGFSIKPAWWEQEYGPGILNEHNQRVWVDQRLWDDLELGLIRRGPRSVVNPYNGSILPNNEWARPGLSNYMPVDAAGNIRSIVEIFNIAITSNPYEPFDGYDSDWVYGDLAPVEYAWHSTAVYHYNIQETLSLMRPAAYGELHWDTLGVDYRIGRVGAVGDYNMRPMSYFNYQYVQNDRYSSDDKLYTWMRPKNKNQYVHAEDVDGVLQLRNGYQQWVSDRILFYGKNITDTFGVKVRNLDVNLGNKFAGFTNKDTVNTYIESVSIQSNTRSLGVPSKNFSVLLHKGQPLASYSYSGVIIRALADGSFAVYGYDLLNSQFTVLERSDATAIEVTVGGTPAEFRYFEIGATYLLGDIIRYNGGYYMASVEHTAYNFDSTVWKKIPALPVVGGISVTYKPTSKASVARYAYGTVFNSVQAVFDFLIGWGAYLESQGWDFSVTNTEDNQVNDWLYSAKQFLFWLNGSWAPNATIQLSPLATQATLTVGKGYPNNVELISNGVYSILDKRGVAIPIDKTVTERDGRVITVRPTDLSAGGIFFLQVNSSETEHIILFDNFTEFNDVIYHPLLRTRQDRIRFNGFRSKQWYGKMEAPGYLIMGDRLVPNYDSLVSDMRHYYDPDIMLDNPNLEELGRRLIGFEQKPYLDNIQISNDTQYLFYQGMIRERGTAKSLDKLFRSAVVNTTESITVYEEWALKVGDIGNVVGQVSTEFILAPEQHTGDTIVARMVFEQSAVGSVQEIRILNATARYKSVPRVEISPPDAPAITADQATAFTTGRMYYPGSLALVLQADGTNRIYRSLITQKPDRFVSENWERVPESRQARAYAILNSNGTLQRVDISDNGYGYTKPPTVKVIADGVESTDRLYAIWRGETITDENKDNIVSIDIDSDEQWVVRPTEPGNSLIFPTTEQSEFGIPNAGYVNMADVDWMTFDIPSTVLNWGIEGFNPSAMETVWIAKTFTEDWGVYKLVPYTLNWKIIKADDGVLSIILDTSEYIGMQDSTRRYRTDLGNLICLQQTSDGKAVAESNYALAIDPNFTVYIDPKDNTAYNSYRLTTLDNTPLTEEDLGNYLDFDTLILFRSLRWYETPSKYRVPIYVGLGDYIWVDNDNGGWSVLKTSFNPGRWDIYKWGPEVTEYYGMTYTSRSEHAYGWDTEGTIKLEVYRKQEPLIDTKLFKNASVFAGKDGNTLIQLPIYDPFKGLFPGMAKQNISYMSAADPARYNITVDDRLLTENVDFLDNHVGKLWWDLSNVRVMYYEQPVAQSGTESLMDNLRYRRDNWGRLFPGSKIDVYEWVKSPVPPSQYSGTGTPRSMDTYIQTSETNIYTGIVNNHYYFWVKDVTTKPGIENRTLSALEVATTLQSTRVHGYPFFAPVQQTDNSNAYMFFNVQDILSNRGRNIRIEYQQKQDDAPVHTQWTLFRENDISSDVKDMYWARLVDSICGYTQEFTTKSPSKSAVQISDNTYIVPVPDPALSEYERYGVRARPTQSLFVDLYAARKVLVQTLNSILMQIPVRDKRPAWDTGLSKKYWTYVTWYRPGYENVRPTHTRNTLQEAYTSLVNNEFTDGNIVEVIHYSRIDAIDRFAIYKVEDVNGALALIEVAVQDSAVKLLDTVYTSRNQYDLSVELRQMMEHLKRLVFIDDFYIYRNAVFSAMLNFVLSEQKTPDWVFKTSMITVKEGVVELTQDRMYVPNQVEDIIDYITDTKPYHTHVREYTTVYSANDVAKLTAKDILKTKVMLRFNPGRSIFSPDGWDTFYWDTYGWESVCDDKVYDEVVVDAQTYRNTSGKFGMNPLLVQDVATILSSDRYYKVDIDTYDSSKVGQSSLFPYTFSISSNLVPDGLIGIIAGNKTLYMGRDYYVEQNANGTYTAYLYADPGADTLTGIVALDGGDIIKLTHPTYRSEYAFGYPIDNSLLIVDTQLAVEYRDGKYIPLAGWGRYWSSLHPDSSLSKAIRQVNNLNYPYSVLDKNDPTNIKWDNGFNINTGKIVLVDHWVSFRQHLVLGELEQYMRNSDETSGVLSQDLARLGRADDTVPFTASNEHIQTVRVYVDSATHINTDILPDPVDGNPGVVWVNGERIEYLKKQQVADDTWELLMVRRGSRTTSPMKHLVQQPSKLTSANTNSLVFVEQGNELPTDASTSVWHSDMDGAEPLISSMYEPGCYTSIKDVSQYGLWYSAQRHALFIVDKPGRAIK